MNTQTTPTRHPRILAAMALTLAISAAPALAEPDQPQPEKKATSATEALADPATLAAKKEGGPDVVMVVKLRGRSGFHYSGYRGENFWFQIQEVHRYHNPRPDNHNWELFCQAMQEQAKDMEGNHQIKLELHAFDDRIQRVEKATDGHDRLILAFTLDQLPPFASLLSKHDWGAIEYENLCIRPFTRKNLAKIDDTYVEWRKHNPKPVEVPMTKEEIQKALRVGPGIHE